MDSKVEDVQWIKSAERLDKIVLVRSRRGTLYRSADAGGTWKNQMDKLATASDGKAGGVSIQSIHVSPSKADNIFLKGYSADNWVSRNQGESYSYFRKPIVEVKMHPTEPDWLLASIYAHPEGSENGFLELLYTKDFGSTWEKLTTHIKQFAWGPAELGDKNAIFACLLDPESEATEQKESRSEVQHGWDANVHFYRSTDFFQNQEMLVPHGNRFAFFESFLFVAAINPKEELEVTLKVSTDKVKTFHLSQFPYKLTEHSYTILDTSENAAFVHVNHGSPTQLFGNIYVSGPDGVHYAVSLRRNTRDYSGVCDFAKVNGVDGVYLANVADEKNSGDSPVDKQTMITFDKGGEWKPLTAPRKDVNGKELPCEGKCHLHLHGRSSNKWGTFYSSPAATGIIVATGNVGNSLSDRTDEVNTFFSRDAGLTWQEVAKGSQIYEVADHGGLMVLADNMRKTDSVKYTWNEGLTFTDLKFGDEPMEVENIITEPSGKSQTFIVYGQKAGKGLLVQLDFSSLHTKQCKAFEAAGSPDSDYEIWSPSASLRNGACLMGQLQTFTRRKREAACFNGNHDRKQFSKLCQCVDSDFECDFGYEQTEGKDGKHICQPQAGELPQPGPPEDCQDFWFKTIGYRKVAGNNCQGVTGRSPSRENCPRGLGLTILVVAVLVLLLGGFGAFVCMRRNEGFTLFGKTITIGGQHSEYAFFPLRDGVAVDDDDFTLGADDDDTEAQVLGDTTIMGVFSKQDRDVDDFDPRV